MPSGEGRGKIGPMSRSDGGVGPQARARAGWWASALLAAMLLSSCGGSPGAGNAGTGPSGNSGTFVVPHRADGLVWLLSAEALSELSSNQHAAAILRAGKIYEIVGPNNPAVAGWPATLVEDFQSYPSIQRAITSGGLLPDVKAVLYDNEHWSKTPSDEQADPGHYMQLVAQLARSHRLTMIATPGLDLTQNLADTGKNSPQAYLSLGIGRQAAVGNIIDIQAQSQQRDASGYKSFVDAVTAQVLAANRNDTVIAGVTTRDGGSPAVIAAAIDSVLGTVKGFWVNIPGRYDPQAAAEGLVQAFS